MTGSGTQSFWESGTQEMRTDGLTIIANATHERFGNGHQKHKD
jgi:hypothetical protein